MTQERRDQPSENDKTCGFCGKTQNAVSVILVSQESAICDDCLVVGLETVSKQPGQLHLRVAFGFFKFVASLGHALGFGRRNRKS